MGKRDGGPQTEWRAAEKRTIAERRLRDDIDVGMVLAEWL